MSIWVFHISPRTMFARLFVARRAATSVMNRSISTHRHFSSTPNPSSPPPPPSTPPAPSAASQSLSLALRAWRVTRDKSAATRHFDDAQRQASISPEPDIAALAYGHGAMFAIYVQDDFEAATALLVEAVRILKLQQVSTRTRFTVHWQVAQFAHNFQSDWTAAEMHYKAALAIDDSNADLHVAYARMFIDRGGGRSDYATATRMLQQITSRWPDCAPALTWLGFIADQVILID
jgi:hypothetical protein